jgi:hypothetical protein
MSILILKNLYIILKSTYIQFEEYGASTGMNGDKWMLDGS